MRRNEREGEVGEKRERKKGRKGERKEESKERGRKGRRKEGRRKEGRRKEGRRKEGRRKEGRRKGGMKEERKGRGGGKRQSRKDIYTCRYSSSYMHTYVSSSLIPKLCSPSKWPGNEVSFSDNIPLNPIQQSLEHTHTHTESPSSIPSLTPLRTHRSAVHYYK